MSVGFEIDFSLDHAGSFRMGCSEDGPRSPESRGRARAWVKISGALMVFAGTVLHS